jgi:hypothetical protein
MWLLVASAPAQDLTITMAGYIDGHRHLSDNEDFEAQMLSLLEAGYTTILEGGGNGDA